MEIKTCEQYVLTRIKELEDENQKLVSENKELRSENDRLDMEYNIILERIGKYLFVRHASTCDSNIVDMHSLWNTDDQVMFDWFKDTFNLKLPED